MNEPRTLETSAFSRSHSGGFTSPVGEACLRFPTTAVCRVDFPSNLHGTPQSKQGLEMPLILVAVPAKSLTFWGVSPLFSKKLKSKDPTQ